MDGSIEIIVDQVNTRPLGAGCTPNPSMDNPIDHNGWKIYQWTGWKGLRHVSTYDEKGNCLICGKKMAKGQLLALAWGRDPVHYECSKDEGAVAGQWLAIRGELKSFRERGPMAYSSVPGAAGLYFRGDCFYIEPVNGQKKLFYDTPQEELDAARETGLAALKHFIDEYERIIALCPGLPVPMRDSISVFNGGIIHIFS